MPVGYLDRGAPLKTAANKHWLSEVFTVYSRFVVSQSDNPSCVNNGIYSKLSIYFPPQKKIVASRPKLTRPTSQCKATRFMPPPPISHSPHTWPSPPKVSRPYIWVLASSTLFKHMQNVQLSSLCEGGPSLLWVSGSDRRIYAVCPCETLENSRKTKSTTFSVNVIARARADEGICSNISWTLVGNRVPVHRIVMRNMESTKYGLMQAGGYVCTCV